MNKSQELLSTRLDLVESILQGLKSGDLETLEEQIFHFGSLIREKDYLERKLFVYMTSQLDLRKTAL